MGSNPATPTEKRQVRGLIRIAGRAPEWFLETEPQPDTGTVRTADASTIVAQAHISTAQGAAHRGVRLTATSGRQCGKATGGVTLTPRIAGAPVTVSGDPNTEVPLVGGGRLIVREQLPSAGADAGLKVNGVHLVLPAEGGEVVLASTESARHNCGG